MSTTSPEAPAGPLPKEGDILAGKYRIESVLGQGGMGVVVAAQHVALRQKVALKFLLPEAITRPGATERFLREARASVSIQGEHVAKVMDVGTLETGGPYMVMEFLTGRDLGAVLAERGWLPIPEAIDYILQAGEAIAEAHSLGIIHRDLKPANLFLTRRTDGSPLVKVLDFGLSKVTTPEAMEPSLTAANVVMGSPSYMSPEQIKSLKGIDSRTDIWAIGVILYQMLCAVRPFEAESLGALFFTIGAETPKPLRAHRPEIPPELEAAVLRCLEKDPARRPQTIAELARSIAPFADASSRVAVTMERIHGVLSDATPFARQFSISDGTPGGNALEAAARMVPSAPPPAPISVSPALSAPLAPLAPPSQAAAGPLAPAGGGISGSMSALATNARPVSAPPPARGRGRLVVAGAAVALALGGAAAFVMFGMHTTAGNTGAAAAAMVTTPKPTSPVPSAAPTAAPAPPPAATAEAHAPAEPTASAEPSASAEASASAAPSVTAEVPASPKVGAPSNRFNRGTRKSKDVLDKWK